MGMSYAASGSGLMNIITGDMSRHQQQSQQQQKRQQVWTTCMNNEQQQEIREKGEGERQLGRERGWERGEGKRWGEEDGKWVGGSRGWEGRMH